MKPLLFAVFIFARLMAGEIQESYSIEGTLGLVDVGTLVVVDVDEADTLKWVEKMKNRGISISTIKDSDDGKVLAFKNLIERENPIRLIVIDDHLEDLKELSSAAESLDIPCEAIWFRSRDLCQASPCAEWHS